MEVLQQVTEVRANLHDSWKNVTDKGTHWIVAATVVGMC